MYANRFNNVYDYIKNEAGHYYALSHRGIKNDDIRNFCNSKGIKVKVRETRKEMLSKLFETDDYVLEFYETFREYISVSFFDYNERFNVSKEDYDRLKKDDFFEIECYYKVRSRAYGWIEVPALSAEQFFNMTQEEVDKALGKGQQALF